jgi:hypothetical protein
MIMRYLEGKASVAEMPRIFRIQCGVVGKWSWGCAAEADIVHCSQRATMKDSEEQTFLLGAKAPLGKRKAVSF